MHNRAQPGSAEKKKALFLAPKLHSLLLGRQGFGSFSHSITNSLIPQWKPQTVNSSVFNRHCQTPMLANQSLSNSRLYKDLKWPCLCFPSKDSSGFIYQTCWKDSKHCHLLDLTRTECHSLGISASTLPEIFNGLWVLWELGGVVTVSISQTKMAKDVKGKPEVLLECI